VLARGRIGGTLVSC